jgi:acetyl-CoA carboxylase, biotin carboxylase subunit
VRSGLDLVRMQIEVGAGHRLSLPQDRVALRGHAIECRINAEDPSQSFRPAPGVITHWKLPAEERVRIDTHVRAGYEVPPFYDSLIAKVIAHGDDRDDACDRMIRALEGLECEGIPTTIPMHLAILRSRAFRENAYDNRAIPGWPA